MPSDLVTVERYVVGPAACLSKANEQARLVERKACCFSHSNWWGEWTPVSKANSPNPHDKQAMTAFVDMGRTAFVDMQKQHSQL